METAGTEVLPADAGDEVRTVPDEAVAPVAPPSGGPPLAPPVIIVVTTFEVACEYPQDTSTTFRSDIDLRQSNTFAP